MAARAPTQTELQSERSLLVPVVADFAIVALLLAGGVLGGSLTLLSEGIRGGAMTAVGFYGLTVMRAIHRGRLDAYEFGLARLEQFVVLIVGLALVFAGLWVAEAVMNAVLADGPTASPLGLAFAATINALNTLVNFVGWWGMREAAQTDTRDVFRAQLRARATMLTSSVFLQVTLTLAALAKDPVFALLLDSVGAAFVAALMVIRGLGMVAGSVPILLDAPPPPPVSEAIRETVNDLAFGDAVIGVRLRRSSTGVVAVLNVAAHDGMQAGELLRHASIIRDALADQGMADQVEVVPVLMPAAMEPR